MPKISLLLLTSLFLINCLFAQTADWQQKVDPSVLENAANQGQVEYLVLMKQQTDLSPAKQFRRKVDKGTYVYRQLQQTAQESQQTARRMIRAYEAAFRPHWIVNAIWVESDGELLRELALLPEVAGIHPNPRIPFDPPQRSGTATLRDPQSIEWGITNIGADLVWNMGYTGSGVVIGGQDTGVEWDHPAIQDQYRGWDGSTADHNYNWHDAIHTGMGNPCGTDTVVPCDDHNHGTHTVGTMTGDDGGSNQIGVAPGAQWIACRNMDEGEGTPDTYLECFEWFLAPTDLNDNNPDPGKAPHVINNSWSCPTSEGCDTGNFNLLETAVNNLVHAGVVVVASAGNGGRGGCNTVNAPPAIFKESFSVGATDNSNDIADFSSRGDVTVDGSNRMKPNVAAPGVSVRSCIRNNSYATWNGTSMAGPHVAGTVALMISAEPSLAGDVAQITSILESTSGGQTTSQTCGGVPAGSTPNNTYGYGIIDALAAVNAVMALPVSLTDFYAQPIQTSIKVFWSTATEVNSDYFVLEKSRDLKEWIALEQISAQQNSDVDQQYMYEDISPFQGTNYYRLKQVDLDGSFEYSKVIAAELKRASRRFSVYPNPVREHLTVQAAESSVQPVTLKVFNSIGQELHQDQLRGATHRISTNGWGNGWYYLVLQNQSGRVIFEHRLIKM